MDGQGPEFIARRIQRRAGELGITQGGLARATGIPKQSVSGYWNGTQVLGADRLFALSDALDMDARELLTGTPPAPIGERLRQNLKAAAAAHEASNDDFVEVEEVDLAYGLGGTFSGDSAVQVELHRFPRAWLASITSTPAKLLFIARGRGNSMEPTVHNGDMMIIDRSQRIVREDDALWAITIGEIASIKRLRIRGDKVHLLSDNEHVPNDTVHGEEINVVGRVIFIGRLI